MLTNASVVQVPNPFLSANFVSKIFFLWTWSFFKKGLRKTITEEDIPRENPTLECEKLTNTFDDLWKTELDNSAPSVFRVVFKYCGWSVLLKSLSYSVLELTCYAGRPICLGLLVEHFSSSSTSSSSSHSSSPQSSAYWYGAGLVGSVFFPLIGFHQLTFFLRLASERTRIGLSGLIYQKIMKLSSSNDGLNAKAINILSTDMSKFELAFIFVYRLWRGPFEAVVFGYLMYREVGPPALIGLMLLIAFIPFQIWAGKKAVYYRRLTAERTDYRVKLMNEIIHGIQVIKMYAWEKSFSQIISDIRKKELKGYQGRAFIMAAVKSSNILSKISIFLSILGYIYLENDITARKVFMVSSFFNILSDSMTLQFPLAITLCGEVFVSFSRIGEFLLEGDHRQKVKTYDSELEQSLMGNKFVVDGTDEIREHTNDLIKEIRINNITAKWDSNFSLKIEDLNIEGPSLIGIVGPVGSGKSTFLNVILGEVPLTEGEVKISGKISYASQEPWVFEGTIKENIVFTENFSAERYNEVLTVCGLKKDLDILPQRDDTVVGERGLTLSGGQKARVNLARAIYRDADIYLLDDPLSAVDAHVGRWIFEECLSKYLKGKLCILATHQIHYLKNLECVVVLENGEIVDKGPGKDVLKGNHIMDGSDVKVLEEDNFPNAETNDNKRDQKKEHQQEGRVDWKCYLYYFRCLGSPLFLIIILFLFVASRAVLTGVDYFLAKWVTWEEQVQKTQSIEVEEYEEKRNYMINLYCILLSVGVFLFLTRTYSFFITCLKIAERMHQILFEGVSKATMYFFKANSSGRILNRFSKDISVVDSPIPATLLDCLQFFVDASGVFIIVSIANLMLIIPAVLVVVLLIGMRHLYINCSRDVYRVSSILRSPIYSLTNQTFQGLTTIRSFEAQSNLEKEFQKHMNAHTGSTFLVSGVIKAFALWSDMICVLYIACVTFSFLIFKENYESGNVGLALLYCLTLIGTFQFGIRQTAELENLMTSVERIKEYCDVKPEENAHSEIENWPSEGGIVFKDLSLKYSEEENDVLQKINFIVEPKDKIGIVGRTGAGKSSIIQAIFRLALNEGSIEIDGLDTKSINLSTLRSKVSIIPQDPILFSGTLRYNLDPFEKSSDDELWNALKAVELKSYISNMTLGVNCLVQEGGSNFSVGQRQLVCLARAILRKNKILILDEATANVDPETDKLIQQTIRTRFSDCTVLTIAHRIHTVMDSDKVLVMDSGKIVEYDKPSELLRNKTGIFRKLVEQSGIHF
ncbi:ABCC4.2 family protein [Megaselia abdita]